MATEIKSPLFVSSSVISRLFFKGEPLEICPRQFHECTILGKYRHVSESMLNGLFFETLSLGTTRDGEGVFDLPRKKLTKKQEDENKIALFEGRPPVHVGAKRISQIRIEEQVAVWKKICLDYGIEITDKNVQVEITKRYADGIYLRGHLDVFPAYMLVEDTPMLCIIDTKLTDDITSTFMDVKKGIKWAWGRPEDMDHTQASMYHELVHDIDLSINPHLADVFTPEMQQAIDKNNYIFVYWVFDYGSDNLQNKPIIISWTPTKRAELMETIRKTISTIQYYQESPQGFFPVPKYERCKTCPVKCPDREQVQIV